MRGWGVGLNRGDSPVGPPAQRRATLLAMARRIARHWRCGGAHSRAHAISSGSGGAVRYRGGGGCCGRGCSDCCPEALPLCRPNDLRARDRGSVNTRQGGSAHSARHARQGQGAAHLRRRGRRVVAKASRHRRCRGTMAVGHRPPTSGVGICVVAFCRPAERGPVAPVRPCSEHLSRSFAARCSGNPSAHPNTR